MKINDHASVLLCTCACFVMSCVEDKSSVVVDEVELTDQATEVSIVEKVGEPAGERPETRAGWSAFGAYEPLPEWSGWCGAQNDAAACQDALWAPVEKQTSTSRQEVRKHGFYLWAAINRPLEVPGVRNDGLAGLTNLYGTTGCWSQFKDGTTGIEDACQGTYPAWLSWPNTGVPFDPSLYRGTVKAPEVKGTGKVDAGLVPLDPSGANVSVQTAGLRATRRARQRHSGLVVDPQKVMTVNTVPQKNVPSYALPPLVLQRRCGIPEITAAEWLADGALGNIVDACGKAGAPNVFCAEAGGICDGTAFVNQGDVMIATESLSIEGYSDIQNNRLYTNDTLKTLYGQGTRSISPDIGPRYISTKHMYWPVKGCRPGVAVGSPGCRIRYGALPPWQPAKFRGKAYATNAAYQGYETWGKVVAIDTCRDAPGVVCAAASDATLALAHVTGATAIVTPNPEVYSASKFSHVQLSEEALEKHFSPADRALLDQAMLWAYGDGAVGFEPGDFLVSVAMHVNTKEIDSWTFQSVWWSTMTDTTKGCPLDDYAHCFGQSFAYSATTAGSLEPNPLSGLSVQDIANIDSHVGSLWREHYVMADSYGIRYQLGGTPVTVGDYFSTKPPAWYQPGPPPEAPSLLPVAANVYIEPVIHPLGTNCQNCHRRAGYPGSGCGVGYKKGCGQANYQTAQCASLLGDYGPPSEDPCMTKPWAAHSASGNHCSEVSSQGTLCNGEEAFPVVNTDWIWIIADGHLQQDSRFSGEVGK